MLIGLYTPTAAQYLPYNSETPKVAALLGEMIVTANPNLKIEHIGSTAVPGCWGKGIIDLLVMYGSGCIESARDCLDTVGFQRQGGPEPFPESRPMRVGGIEYLGHGYRIHTHVIEHGRAAAIALLKFRDLLRQDSQLQRAYEAHKRAILARGLTKSNEYSKAKGDFIQRALTYYE